MSDVSVKAQAPKAIFIAYTREKSEILTERNNCGALLDFRCGRVFNSEYVSFVQIPHTSHDPTLCTDLACKGRDLRRFTRHVTS